MTEHFFDGRGICYRTNAFVPDRQTLVFVHGVSGSSSAWRAYEERFQQTYNLLSYDLRGHGKSRKYARCQDYVMAHFVEDLLALLDYLRIDKCVLISHSFAVLITFSFLRANQHRVEAVVLASGDFDVGRSRPAKILRCILAPIALLDHLPFHPRPGRHVDYARYPQSGDWNVPRMLDDVRNTTWRVYFYCSKEGYAVRADSFLPDIHLPVLLLHGRNDTIFPVENSIYMATRIPGARLVVLEDSDHIIILNRPREVADAIEAFLPAPTRVSSPVLHLRS